MTTYRSATEFAERFASAPLLSGRASARFPVERYLEHHGARFAAEWQPARFLTLSLSGDLHAVDPSCVHTPATLIALDDDGVVPRAQMEELAARLGGPSTLHIVPTRRGHDAFLTEPGLIGPILTAALEGIRP
jgi:homoserine O-acetyltransferase